METDDAADATREDIRWDAEFQDEEAMDAEALETHPEPSASAPSDPLASEFALALSGGGYRAAAYHLGVLDVLDRLDRADAIATLSTISGGTILGAAFALSRKRGEAFDAFYDRMHHTLATRNVVEEAFARLDDADGDGTLAPSLIRAAADIYASDDFVGDVRLGDLMTDTPDSHAHRVVFSATEFASGVAFRFQTGVPGQPLDVGNGNFAIPHAVARQIRVADAVAASSCFPSVFEPIRFPDDFDWGDTPLAEIRAQLPDAFDAVGPIALMDGGIYDNQGVNGVLTVYNRRSNRNALGWLMVSDSSPRKARPIMADPEEPDQSGLTVGTLALLAWGVGGLAVASAGFLIAELVELFATKSWTVIDVLTNVVPLLLTVATVAVLFRIRTEYLALKAYAEEKASVDLSPVLECLSVGNLSVLLRGRLESLLALTSDVFMKRIRGLIINGLFLDVNYSIPPENDTERKAPYRRFTLNLIYSTEKNRPTLFKNHPALEPSDAVRTLAKEAADVPTTLWFNDDATLRTVIACGQVTACFSILRFLVAWNPDVATQPGTDQHALYTETLALWEQLQDDPRTLLR